MYNTDRHPAAPRERWILVNPATVYESILVAHLSQSDLLSNARISDGIFYPMHEYSIGFSIQWDLLSNLIVYPMESSIQCDLLSNGIFHLVGSSIQWDLLSNGIFYPMHVYSTITGLFGCCVPTKCSILTSGTAPIIVMSYL